MNDDLKELRRRAGIAEAGPAQGQSVEGIADAFVRYLIGDSEQALRQLEATRKALNSPALREMDPRGYNQIYKTAFDEMLKVVRTIVVVSGTRIRT